MVTLGLKIWMGFEADVLPDANLIPTVDIVCCEESADTYHDHIYRGQDESKHVPKQPQNAPLEGEEHDLYAELNFEYRSCIIRPRGCIMRPFRYIFRFVLASV